jgi:hypothetical protein
VRNSMHQGELLAEDGITALNVVVREHPAHGACSPFEGNHAVRVTLLPPLTAQRGQTEQGNSRSPPWAHGSEPALRRTEQHG